MPALKRKLLIVWFSVAARTKYHKFSSSNNTNGLFYSSVVLTCREGGVGQKSDTGLTLSEGSEGESDALRVCVLAGWVPCRLGDDSFLAGCQLRTTSSFRRPHPGLCWRLQSSVFKASGSRSSPSHASNLSTPLFHLLSQNQAGKVFHF